MNIWIVNPFDSLPGEPIRPFRYAIMADVLTRQGHSVTWWTSSFSHASKCYRNDNLQICSQDGMFKIRFIKTSPYRRNVSLARIWNHWQYAHRFEHEASRSNSKPDLIIASLPPLGSAKAVVRLGRKLGTKTIVDMIDLWPEAFESLLPLPLRSFGRFIFYPWLRQENFILRECSGICATSEDYVKRALSVVKKDKPIALVHTGIDISYFDEVIKTDNEPCLEKKHGEFWIVYAGSISRNYDLETVLNAAVLVRKRGIHNIKFVLVGGGEKLPQLKKQTMTLGLSDVTFTGFINYQSTVKMLSQADAALNPIKEGNYSFLTRKAFDYCAAGLPIINSIKGGELEDIILRQKIGLQYTAGDAISLLEAVMKLYENEDVRKVMGKNSRVLAETTFDISTEYKKFLSLVATVCKKDR